MNTPQTNANRHTDGFTPGRLSRWLSSILPSLRSFVASFACRAVASARRPVANFVDKAPDKARDKDGGALFTVHCLLFTAFLLAAFAPWVQADPPVTSGLTIWLDSTDLNGDGISNNPAAGTLVAQWNNKAGSFHATQGNASYQPKMFRDATTGKDVVRFQRAGLAGTDYARYLKFDSTPSIGTLISRSSRAGSSRFCTDSGRRLISLMNSTPPHVIAS